ncbi:MAG: hypothetical protein ABFS86_15875, partial [Planctomycetota bacterium]
MTDVDNRGLLRVIKVPFDIKAIFLGAFGYIVLIVLSWILNGIWGINEGNVVSGFLRKAMVMSAMGYENIPLVGTSMGMTHLALFGKPALGLDFWQMLVTGIAYFLVVAIFGGAICRVIALRIARDESLGVKEALTFSIGNLRAYVQIPLVLGGAIGFFWGCNWLAGVVSTIPVAGPFLFIVLYPLAILSGLIILLIAVGGVLGLFLMVAAVSTEKNGTLDAISRAFSYLYSRPVAFFFYYFLVFLMAGIIVIIGVFVFLGGGDYPGVIAGPVHTGLDTWGDEYARGFEVGANAASMVEFPGFDGLGFFPSILAGLAWFFMIVLRVCVLGFVVSYVMGGSTAIYFALRRDVDGTEDSEMYVEGAEDEDDFGLPPITPPAAEEKKEEAAEEKPAEEAPAAEETPAEEAPAA